MRETDVSESLEHLEDIYQRRFGECVAYRNRVWRILTEAFFNRWVPADAAVLDLGCGYGEFINNVAAARKLGMDANPRARDYLDAEVELLDQDCSQTWPLPEDSLDVVFTSNFFEHLPTRPALEETLAEAHRCLRSGGRLVALGPNIKYLGGAYWDFWDHYLPLTEASLAEVIEIAGLTVVESVPRFLPYTMSAGRQYPGFVLRAYLRLPIFWRFFGKQFLLVARKD